MATPFLRLIAGTGYVYGQPTTPEKYEIFRQDMGKWTPVASEEEGLKLLESQGININYNPMEPTPPPTTSATWDVSYLPPEKQAFNPTPMNTGTSQIAAGQSYIQNRTALGLSSDEITTKNDYISRGLDKTFGKWRGTPEQYNAMMAFDKTQPSGGTVDLRTQALDYLKSQGYGSPDEGEIRGAMIDITEKKLQEVRTELTKRQTEAKTGGGGNGGGNVVLNPNDINTVSVGSTDLGDIINEISTGTLTTPETVLAQAQAQLLTDDEKAAAVDALTTMQQNLAKQGMTFSGIRTKAEASAAASSLARLTGISLDLSAKIINAARQEQSKRETALTQAKQLQYNSLLAMGYVVDPTTGQLTKTLERERFEEPETAEVAKAPTVIGTESTGYYQWNPDSGQWESTGISGGETTNVPSSWKEWQLAGGEKGTSYTYSEWLQRQNLTQTDRDRALKTAAFAKAQPELEKSKGTDGFVDPGVYMRLRADYGSTIGDANEFDEMFAPMLSLKERLKLGVGKVQL